MQEGKPITIKIQKDWNLEDLAKAAGWPEWSNIPTVSNRLKLLNPTHPGILSGELSPSDPPVIIGYKQEPNLINTNTVVDPTSLTNSTQPFSAYDVGNNFLKKNNITIDENALRGFVKESVNELIDIVSIQDVQTRNDRIKNLFTEVIGKLTSRKFIVTALGILLVLFHDQIPGLSLDQFEVTQIIALILGYVGIEGLTDYRRIQTQVKNEVRLQEERTTN